MKPQKTKYNFVVATHARIYSASQALRDYLRNHGHNLIYISHPLPLVGEQNLEKSYYEISLAQQINEYQQVNWRTDNLIFNFFYEIILTTWWVLRTWQKSDLFIGVDNQNALSGLILKLFGRVRRVVYYTIDYFPNRFANPVFNYIYHTIDRFCVFFADETWNVSITMVEARRRRGMVGQPYARQFRVPIGIWYKTAPRKSWEKIDKAKLIFSGHLVPHMGVDLLISAMPEIIKKLPQVKLEVIGGGQELKNLKKLARNLKLKQKVKFYGWVNDRRRLEQILADGAVGIAPFNTEILDDKVKNADPGKLKDYMLLGMPVIVTNAIAFGNEIKRQKCGIVIRYRQKDLVAAVVKLLSNPKLLNEYRQHALAYVRQFDYNRLFENALNRLFPFL